MQLADEGDEVCKRLLSEQGSILGEMLGYLTAYSGINNLNVPVVLGGSLYTVRNPYIMNSFHKEYSRFVPSYQIYLLDCEPAAGAILLAMEHAGIHVDRNINLYLRKQTQVNI
jgi:N-acetylglucosamine kinase-like BadF-type ATPase